MTNKYLFLIVRLMSCGILLALFGSFTIREISSKSIRQVEKRCKVYAIGTGHDTIGDVKVSKLHFETQGCVNTSQALGKFRQVYWEVMTRQKQQSSSSSLKELILPNDQSGASLMISFTPNNPGGLTTLPYAGIVYNLHDGKVIVDGLNPQTDQFETLAETTLVELYGLTLAEPAEQSQ